MVPPSLLAQKPHPFHAGKDPPRRLLGKLERPGELLQARLPHPAQVPHGDEVVQAEPSKPLLGLGDLPHEGLVQLGVVEDEGQGLGEEAVLRGFLAVLEEEAVHLVHAASRPLHVAQAVEGLGQAGVPPFGGVAEDVLRGDAGGKPPGLETSSRSR